jgi:predicted enzyme related to lactoylglutathione lyase
VLACYQAKTHMGLGVMAEPGAVAWCELATRAPGRAAAFYSALFGWEAQPPAVPGAAHATWQASGRPVGGMAEIPARSGEVAPHWTVHFQVSDLDTAAERARALGGAVLHGPTDAPGLGRLLVLRDPQGAGFALLEPGEAHP